MAPKRPPRVPKRAPRAPKRAPREDFEGFWASFLEVLDAFFCIFLALAVEQRVSDFNTQELANTAWAFATAGQSDAQLFAALARAVEQRVSDVNMQELANTAWAFATAGQLDAQ